MSADARGNAGGGCRPSSSPMGHGYMGHGYMGHGWGMQTLQHLGEVVGELDEDLQQHSPLGCLGFPEAVEGLPRPAEGSVTIQPEALR